MSTKFRPYQHEIDDAIYKELIIENTNKCLVKAFCGTGKSNLMAYGKAFQSHNLKVYVFPSLSLVDQFTQDYLNDCKVVLVVSSESTTDETIISQFMKQKSNKTICITYHSFHLLNVYKIDIAVFDEAHHAIGETYQELIFNNPNIEKACFFTATPKNANGIDMLKDCGKIVYDYPYLRGVAEGYLNPFEIRVDLFGDNTINNVYDSIARAYYKTGNNHILTFHSDVNTESPTSVRNFVNKKEMTKSFKRVGKEFPTMKVPSIKMVGFYSELKLKERRELLKEFDTCEDVFILSSCETMGEGIDTKNANMCVFADSKTSFVKIIQNIGRVVRKQFGVDKPHSTILLPIYINKTKYEACKTAEECDAVIREEMKKGDDFTPILNVMSALKQEDEDLYDICLYYPNNYSPKEMEHNFKAQGYTIGEEQELEEIFDDDLEEVAERDNIQIDIYTDSLEEPIISYGESDRVVSILQTEDKYCKIEGEEKAIKPPKRIRLDVHTNMDVQVLWKIKNIDFGSCLLDCEVNDNWEERLEELKEFIDREKRRPNIKTEKKIANWLNNTITNYKLFKKSMKYNDKRILWEQFIETYNEYIICIDEKWNKILQHLKIFIIDNKKRPSSKSLNKKEKIMGQWLINNNKHFIYNRLNETKHIQFEEFLKEYKEYLKTDQELWFEKINTLQKFIDIYKRRPKPSEHLHSWLSHQIENKDKMNKEKYEYFIKFLDINKEYIKFNDDKWNHNFIKLKEFINIYKRRPNKRTKEECLLGVWLGNQNKQYNKKELDQFKNKQWEEFLKEYSIYLKTIDEVWDDNFIKLKEFLNIHKQRPNPSSNDKYEKFIAKWFGTNQTDYIKKEHGMKDTNKCKQWESFLEEYKHYFKNDDEIWNNNLQLVKDFINKNKRKPKECIQEENKLRKWITTHQKNYNLKLQGFKDNPERCKKWEDFLEEYKQYLNPTKSMTLKPTKEPTESTEQKRQRIKTEISELHQKYKTLISTNLSKLFEDKTKWEHYHTISEKNEESFPKESIPRNQIITELDKIKTKRPKKIVDMGCGKANISKHFNGDKRFEFTNYDHVSNDDSVEECDISRIPLEDDSAEICILSLAMWGSNCKEYIKEAHRILETNGTLYIIEPTKRWTNLEPADRLRELLLGFIIKKETIEKFTMFIAVKI